MRTLRTCGKLLNGRTPVLAWLFVKLMFYQFFHIGWRTTSPWFHFIPLSGCSACCLSYGSSARIYFNGCSARNIDNFIMQAPCKASGQAPHLHQHPHLAHSPSTLSLVQLRQASRYNSISTGDNNNKYQSLSFNEKKKSRKYNKFKWKFRNRYSVLYMRLKKKCK